MLKIISWFDAASNINSKIFDFMIYGMGCNPEINFYILTNDSSKFNGNNFNNVNIIQYNRSELIKKINNLFKFNISEDIPSQEFGRDYICGFKPFIPIIFPEVIDNSPYYGWMDHEIVIESGFDSAIKNFLINNPLVFNIGNTPDSGHFQIIKNSKEWNLYLYNNRHILLNWFLHSPHRKGVIRYFDDLLISPVDYLIGYIGLRKLFQREMISASLVSTPGFMFIGSDYIRPAYDFKIKYENNKFNKSTINLIKLNDLTSDQVLYLKSLNSSVILWSIDRFFKDKYFEIDRQIIDFNFDS